MACFIFSEYSSQRNNNPGEATRVTSPGLHLIHQHDLIGHIVQLGSHALLTTGDAILKGNLGNLQMNTES